MGKQINIHVDAAKTVGKQDHFWRYIGYDECNYTYIPEGVELLNKFAVLGDAPYFVRTHFTFCTGNCHGTYKFGSTNVYTEDNEGNPVYDFTYYDMIMDTYLQTGHKPFVELGCMPQDLVDKAYVKHTGGYYGSYREAGWSCPPKSYEKWHEFIKVLIQHLVERYGAEEVRSWYFELWNEPDIFYWSGSMADYCKLFDYTEHAIHGVDEQIRFSGPAVTGMLEGYYSQKFLRYFLNHCKSGANFCTGEKGTRLDFITFHVKGGGFPFRVNASKSVPSVESLVHQVKKGLDVIVECGYQDREVVLSEADPDGWAAGGIYDNANMIFRNTEYYATYVASTYDKIEQLGLQYGMQVKPLAWAFFFPGERCFEGTRTFTTQGIDKAVFNMFKIYGQLGDEKLAFTSDGGLNVDPGEEPAVGNNWDRGYTGEGEDTDVSGFAVRGNEEQVQIVIYSHCNDRDKQADQKVTVRVDGLNAENVLMKHYRIDSEHSNPYAEWVRQGKPLFPQGEQYAVIKSRDGLEKYCDDAVLSVEDQKVNLTFDMPAHGVSYIVLEQK